MAEYSSTSKKAEEFINDEKIKATLAFAEAHKDDLELMYFVNAVIDEVLASGQYETWFNEASERAAELGL